MLSNKAKYGLKALLHLAERERSCFAADIAEDNQIPKKFLDAILLELRNAGFLRSKTGKNGGYHLAMEPDRIVIGDVIRVLDGPIAPIACASRSHYQRCADCVDEEGCAIRSLMVDVTSAISGVLDRTSLTDLRRRAGRRDALSLLYDI